MLYSIQIPIRGPQVIYDRQIDALSRQTCQDFEVIVCDDCAKKFPCLKPQPSLFPQKMVRIVDRIDGWGYPIARNAALDNCSKKAKYMVRLDGDWVLRNTVLEDILPLLSTHTLLEGFKLGSNGKLKEFAPFSVMPLDAVFSCGGWEEAFFPWYSDWEDFKRRLLLVREFEIKSTELLFADDTGEADMTTVRDRSHTRKLAKFFARQGTTVPLMRDLFENEVVFKCGYKKKRSKNENCDQF